MEEAKDLYKVLAVDCIVSEFIIPKFLLRTVRSCHM